MIDLILEARVNGNLSYEGDSLHIPVISEAFYDAIIESDEERKSMRELAGKISKVDFPIRKGTRLMIEPGSLLLLCFSKASGDIKYKPCEIHVLDSFSPSAKRPILASYFASPGKRLSSLNEDIKFYQRVT